MDYKKLGLKAGIECHQQLSTKKLFCNCESKLTEEKGDLELKRKLRPVSSETGKFDRAALQEFKKAKESLYEGIKNDICLVELDEEPPHNINQDALNTAFEIALKTGAEIFDNTFVMRKLVLDGSNTSGFQRTALIAQNGHLEIDDKQIRIESICLEEDACKNLENSINYNKYKLDRLGIPLIEFTTAPDMNTPKEVKECARKIGELFRITGKAKRGLGSIRQDVNVSIKGGARVEIKGVQYLELIDEYVKNEANRQVKLLELKDILIKKNNKDKQKFVILDVTSEFEDCENKRVYESIKKEHRALAIILNGFKGLIGLEIQENRRIGTELAGYAKAKAKVSGLFHSDELPKYQISKKIVENIKNKIGLKKDDAFIIVVEKEPIAKKALKAIFDRAMELYDGVPEETRNPLDNGNSEYSRPLPGASRMYPETDVPIIKAEKSNLNKINKSAPLWYDERIKMYETAGLNKSISTQIAKSNLAKEFTKRIGKYEILALADFIRAIPEGKDISDFEWIIKKIDRKNYKNAIQKVLKGISQNNIIESFSTKALDNDAKIIIKEVIANRNAFIRDKGMGALNPIMGASLKEIVSKTGNKPDMKELSEFINKEIKKYL